MKRKALESVRFKLFAVFFGLMAGFVTLGMILCAFFLEDYYIAQSKGGFDAARDRIVEAASSDEGADRILWDVFRSEGMTATLVDAEMNVVASSNSAKAGRQLSKNIVDSIAENEDALMENPLYLEMPDNSGQARLAYLTGLEDGSYLVLSKSMAAVRESSAIAAQFYCIVGIVVLLIGGLVVLAFSGRIVKPVVQMNVVAERIARLDFGQKVEVKSADEIGALAQSINAMSDRLEENVRQLEQDVEFQQTLTRNIAHDLKTPAGIIMGYSEGLACGLADDQQARDRYIQVIVDECKNVDNLVKAMLAYSRLSTQKYELSDLVDVDVSEAAGEVVRRFADEACRRSVDIALRSAKGDCVVRGNAQHIQRALTNLVSNAIKYCKEGGAVRVDVAEVCDNVRFSIENPCEDVSKEELPRLFDAFYRLDSSREKDTDGGGGHGLGLSVVKAIAESHGGSVAVRSVEGGIAFDLLLPKRMEG